MSVINTNVKSLIAQDSLRANNNKLATAMERLSTGSKVNSAKDDAAGLAIGTRMTSQVRGLNMAIKNANDGINLAQTAEGAMTEVTDMLQRMRELAVQAGNSTNSDSDRAAMNDEVNQLKSEINRIASTTQFNGMNIMDGSFQGKKLQIGNNANQTMELGVKSVSTSSMGETAAGLAVGATTAKLSVSGTSTNAAAYQGASFNVNVNGVNKTVTLPPAQDITKNVAGAVAAKAFTTVDASADNQSSGQIGGVYERTLDLSTAANAKIGVKLNNAAVVTVDISNSDYYADSTHATGAEIAAALKAELDKAPEFQGVNELNVSLDNGHIAIGLASGAKGTLAVSDVGTAGANHLINKLTGAATTVSVTSGSVALGAKTADFSNKTSFDIGNNHFDLAASISSHGYDVAKLTGEQFVQVYNEVAKVNGTAVSSASLDAKGKLTFSIAEPKAPAVGSPYQNSSLLTTVSAITNGSDATVFANSATSGQFGEYETTVTAGTNDVLTLRVNGGTTANIQIAADTYTSFSNLAAQVQSKIDASGAFTGTNAVTVSAVQDDNNRWGLKVTNANGSDVEIGGTFLTKTTAAQNSGLGTTPVAGLPTAVTTDGTSSTTEASVVTFKAMAAGETITVGGLSYTALAARTAVQVGVAFSALADGATGTSDANGTFSGKLAGFSTAATTTAVATFTSSTANANVTDILISGGKSLENTTTVIGSVTDAAVDHLVTVHGPDFPPAAGAAAFKEHTVDLSATADGQFDVTLYGGTAVSLDLATAISDRKYDEAALTGEQLVNVLNDTFAANGAFAGNNAITASLTDSGQIKLQLASVDPTSGSPALNLADGAGNFATKVFGATVEANANSDTLGSLVLSNAGDAERFGIKDMTLTSSNNALTIEVGNGNPVNLTIDAATYTDAYAVADNVRTQIANSGAFTGANALSVSVVTDADGNQGLNIQSATGESVKISGTFVTSATALKESAAVTFPPAQASVGGVDLSGGDEVTLAVADSAGKLVSKTFSLGSTGAHVSFGDYASKLQSAANTAFASENISFTASVANGSFSFKADQTNVSSTDLSGSGVTAAFGSTVHGNAETETVAASKFTSMSDVAAAINEDLGGAATAAFDAASNSWSFTAGGAGGTASTISLSGAGLSSVQIGGTLSATGAAGNATAAKLSDIDVLTTDDATSALASIDNSIQYISDQRANLGAIQNRLEHTVNNLTNIVTNTEASRSAIMDADYSKETTALAKSQILTQAATAMLAQANQSSQGVLSLLK